MPTRQAYVNVDPQLSVAALELGEAWPEDQLEDIGQSRGHVGEQRAAVAALNLVWRRLVDRREHVVVTSAPVLRKGARTEVPGDRVIGSRGLEGLAHQVAFVRLRLWRAASPVSLV